MMTEPSSFSGNEARFQPAVSGRAQIDARMWRMTAVKAAPQAAERARAAGGAGKTIAK